MEEPKLEIHSGISTMPSLLPVCQTVLKRSGSIPNFVLGFHYKFFHDMYIYLLYHFYVYLLYIYLYMYVEDVSPITFMCNFHRGESGKELKIT